MCLGYSGAADKDDEKEDGDKDDRGVADGGGNDIFCLPLQPAPVVEEPDDKAMYPEKESPQMWVGVAEPSSGCKSTPAAVKPSRETVFALAMSGDESHRFMQSTSAHQDRVAWEDKGNIFRKPLLPGPPASPPHTKTLPDFRKAAAWPSYSSPDCPPCFSHWL
ncbi:hypothetical protein H920_15295 [Fukomys damarensis]|uniref:Uncharacterized protein n=1 Tax=Fukomys damarensis TaxID=885580 RepID=A0A091CUY9_FUKDA|nr:hypothetical protein H920_15295 [Fukomys damarensis]